jgi:hypothetical protein
MPHISLKANMVLVMITIACRAFNYVGRFLCPTLNLGIIPKFAQKTVLFGTGTSEEIRLNADEKLL